MLFNCTELNISIYWINSTTKFTIIGIQRILTKAQYCIQGPCNLPGELNVGESVVTIFVALGVRFVFFFPFPFAFCNDYLHIYFCIRIINVFFSD